MMAKQTVFLHDGSFEGMLHAIAIAIKSKDKVRSVYAERDYRPLLFETPILLSLDKVQASRFFQYLKSLQGAAARLAINGHLSEDPDVGTHLYKMVQECLKFGGGVSQCHSHGSVNYLQKLSRKVDREAHRFEGLIRFRILGSGVQYAPFEPDFNIIGYCASHFKNRLKNVNWVLHDVRRNLAVFWDGRSLQYVDVDKELSDQVRREGEVLEHMLCSSEKDYQQLWQVFHTAIANKDRKNLDLQRQHMPRRYWKYLVESP